MQILSILILTAIVPDYYESNIPIYNGNCIVSSPNIQDTDGDTLKDGEEIIIRKEYIPLTNNVRVYVTRSALKIVFPSHRFQ